MRNGHGALFCCTSARYTIDALVVYLDMYLRAKDEEAINLPMAIAICKHDHDEAPFHEINKIAQAYHIKHVFITSALEDRNVKEAFEKLALLTVDPLEKNPDWATKLENGKSILKPAKKSCSVT